MEHTNDLPRAKVEGLEEILLPPPLPKNYIALSPAEPLLTTHDTYWGLVARQRGIRSAEDSAPGYLVYEECGAVIFYTADELLRGYDQMSQFLPHLLPYSDQDHRELIERVQAAQEAYAQVAKRQLLARCRAYIEREEGAHE